MSSHVPSEGPAIAPAPPRDADRAAPGRSSDRQQSSPERSTPDRNGRLRDRLRQAGPKPAWLKVPLPGGPDFARLRSLARELSLHTVCEEARCPNVGECWKGAEATLTLMVLGRECTRRCRFCAVETVERAAQPDPKEPEHVGRAVAALELGYVVLTSVDRDDLPDGGAAHYAACVRAVRGAAPRTVVETLIPDYQGADLAALMESRPDVLAHNVEVVPRLQRRIRDPRCSFERSLETLRGARRIDAQVFTKSSLMLGLGERADEVCASMRLLREAEVDFLTLGQYLRPSANHAPVREYVPPARFEELRAEGLAMGFKYVAAGPLVRSSYKAGEFFAARLVRARKQASQAETMP
jgi:lipoic acid synthetase